MQGRETDLAKLFTKQNTLGCKYMEGIVRIERKTEEADMKPTVLYYAKCSTCQKALKWLDEKGIEIGRAHV